MTLLQGSLRLRLLGLILVPLVVVSALMVAWRFNDARGTAEGIFDRNLIMLGLAVSRDVALSGGDTLSDTTANLFSEATGGPVFYHVYGPDGSFVTGYSSPPVRRPANVRLDLNTPVLFDAVHQGEPVRAVSLAERVTIDGISGVSVVTVWQQLQPRLAFANRLAGRAVLVTASLLSTVAAVVFFGVALGLRPLKQLEQAIQRRSTTDLRPIDRQVPKEARGIVQRLNTLFKSLTEAKDARERLISNAAHQLRNPVAAIHTMAQAVETAKTLEDSQTRAGELVAETRQAMRLTQQLLSLEGVQGRPSQLVSCELNVFLKEYAARVGPRILDADVSFDVDIPKERVIAKFDETLMQEALTNLIDNALQHGGQRLDKIWLHLATDAEAVIVEVGNTGQSVPTAISEQVFERFTQGSESSGAGLGLAIVAEIVSLHGGTITLRSSGMTCFEIRLPKENASRS